MKLILLTLKDDSFRAEKTEIFCLLVGGNHGLTSHKTANNRSPELYKQTGQSRVQRQGFISQTIVSHVLDMASPSTLIRL